MLKKNHIEELLTIINNHPTLDPTKGNVYLEDCRKILERFEKDENKLDLEIEFRGLVDRVIKDKLDFFEEKIELLKTTKGLNDPTLNPMFILSWLEFAFLTYKEYLSDEKIIELEQNFIVLKASPGNADNKMALLQKYRNLELNLMLSVCPAINEKFKNYKDSIGYSKETESSYRKGVKTDETKTLNEPVVERVEKSQDANQINVLQSSVQPKIIVLNQINQAINELLNVDVTMFQMKYEKLMPVILSRMQSVVDSKEASFDIKAEQSRLNYLLSLAKSLGEKNTSRSEIFDFLKHVEQTVFLLQSKVLKVNREEKTRELEAVQEISSSVPLVEEKRLLFQAILDEDAENIKDILMKNNDDPTIFILKNHQNEIPLECAIKNNKIKSIEAIIQCGGFIEDLFRNAPAHIKTIMENTKSIRRENTIDEAHFKSRGYKVVRPSTRLGKVAEGEYDAIQKQYSQEYDIFPSGEDPTRPGAILLVPKSRPPMTNYYMAMRDRDQFSLKKRVGWELVNRQCKKIAQTYAAASKKIPMGNSEINVFDLSEFNEYRFFVHAPGDGFLKTKKLGGKEESVYFSCSLIDKHHDFVPVGGFALILEVPTQAIAYASPADLSSPTGKADYRKMTYVDSFTLGMQTGDSQESERQSENKEYHEYLPKPRYSTWINLDSNFYQSFSKAGAKHFATVEEILSFQGQNELIVLGDKLNPLPQKIAIRGIIMQKGTFDEYRETEKGCEKLNQLKEAGLPIVLVKTTPSATLKVFKLKGP